MTLDSSAVIAILFGEHGHLELVDRILAADHVRIGTPTVVETSMVFTSRRRSDGAREVQELLQELGVTIVPFGEREWHAATAAFLRFGGRRHAASLNFGDCLAYAVAQVAHDSLLFVGDDFTHTDVAPA
jgi:ribonuclease VapC